MSLISAGSISLDSTFNKIYLVFLRMHSGELYFEKKLCIKVVWYMADNVEMNFFQIYK